MIKQMRSSLVFAALLSSALFAGAVNSEEISTDLKEKQAALDSLSENVMSSQLSSSPSPIGARGHVVSRLHDGNFYKAPDFISSFAHRTILLNQANVWLTLTPNPFFTLSTALTFGADYHGTYTNKFADAAGNSLDPALFKQFEPVPQDFSRYREVISTEREAVGIFEEMLIKGNVRTPKVSAEITLGGAQWIQMSPMLIWRRDPRHKYAWYYEAYEPEQTVDALYQTKQYNRLDYGGVATWPRRTFGGIHADIYQLPLGLSGQFLIGEPVNSRATMPRATMMSHYGDAEAITSVSHSGMVYAAQLARQNVIGGANLAVGFLASNYNDDIVNDFLQQPNSAVYSGFGNKSWQHQFIEEEPFVYEPRIFSISSMGMLKPSLYWESDAAFSFERKRTWSQKNDGAGRDYYYAPDWNNNKNDMLLPMINGDPIAASKEEVEFLFKREGEDDAEHFLRLMTVYSYDPNDITSGTVADSVANYFNGDIWENAMRIDRNNVITGAQAIGTAYATNRGFAIYDVTSPVSEELTHFSAAYYIKLYKEGTINSWMFEGLVAGPDFFSPYSLTQNTLPIRKDRIKLGIGNNVLQSNIAGGTFTWIPKLSDGYLRIGLGAHAQIEKGNDIIIFQHKLWGRDWWKASTFWSKTEPDRHWDEGRPYNTDSYQGRLGLQDPTPLMNQQQDGGLFGDDYELWEEFGVYDDDPILRAVDTTLYVNLDSMMVIDSLYDLPPLPQSRKLSLSASIDWGKPLTSSLFLNIYGEYNQLSRLKEDENPFAPIMNEVLLITEPSYAIGKNFAIIGMAGVELFMAENAMRNAIRNGGVEEQPDVLLGPREITGAAIGVKSFTIDAYRSEIDYLQYAFGLGFDWDFSKRASLHVRYKWATHIDRSVEEYNKELKADANYKTAVDSYDRLMTKSEETPLTRAEYSELADAYKVKSKQEKQIIDNNVTAGFLFVETKVWF